MSAKNRKKPSDPFGDYPTPDFAIKALQEVPIPGNIWLEPCAGSGNIIRVVNSFRQDIEWTVGELQEKHLSSLGGLFMDHEVEHFSCPQDFLTLSKTTIDLNQYFNFDAVVSNPPYTYAEEFIVEGLKYAPVVVYLLRTNFLESTKRAEFFQTHMPDVFVLSKRPSFSGDGKTDGTSYSWMIFYREPRSEGICRVINCKKYLDLKKKGIINE